VDVAEVVLAEGVGGRWVEGEVGGRWVVGEGGGGLEVGVGRFMVGRGVWAGAGGLLLLQITRK